MRIIDTHCHLYDAEAFPNPAYAIEEANRHDIDKMIVVGTNAETSRKAVELAERFVGVFAVVGWHPNCAADYSSDQIAVLDELAKSPTVVAIGEMGLDYHWDYATREQQEKCLFDQLEWAETIKKPIVFHCREAYDDLLTILEKRSVGPCVVHCFGGNEEQASRALALGAYLGVDGPITFPKSDELRAVIGSAPRDRILVETDAPYLAPVPHRGKPNEPANVRFVVEAIAKVWGVSTEQAAQITTENAQRLFFS